MKRRNASKPPSPTLPLRRPRVNSPRVAQQSRRSQDLNPARTARKSAFDQPTIPHGRVFRPRRVAYGLVCLGGLVALVLAVLFLAARSSPAGAIADRLAGERWYAVMFRHRPVGHYRAETHRTPTGDFAFRTELQFKMAGDVATRMEDTLVFHQHPPHPLLRAEHTASAGKTRQTRVQIADGFATVSDATQERQTDFDGDLAMADYLAIERWLAEGEPPVGATRSARAVDFDRLAVVSDNWRLLARDPDGVEVGKDAVADSTYVRMDNDFVPQRMQIGALFSLEAVADESLARLWEQRPAIFSRTESVPVDRPIRQPQALRRLVVDITHTGDDVPPWIAAMPSLLTSDAGTAPIADPNDVLRASAATVSHPADDPLLQALAERAVAGLAHDTDRAAALAGFVHGHLRYRDTDHAGGVLDTMRRRVGDCTEFADFYTTLARAVGLPARTVVGLAYREEPREGAGAFALHAWNEVAVGGVWRGVDPTWNQGSADLTHLRLPEAFALALIAELPNLSLRVVEAVY